MPNLKLHLFGAPQWLLDGLPLQGFVTRKAEALLIYLAVTQQIHRRDTLTALFWPEIGEEHARNNLRRTFSNLRNLVGSHLVIGRQTAAFASQSYWLDVQQFTTLLSPLCATTKPASLSIATLEEALALYRNDFLAGFNVREVPLFDAWVGMEREYLHQLAVQAMQHLTNLYLQQQAFGPGLAMTQRLLALEPWCETAHQQRMRLFSLIGQPANALAQFEICRQILAKEVGTEPQPETVALYQQIKTGALSLHYNQSTATATVVAIEEREAVDAQYNHSRFTHDEWTDAAPYPQAQALTEPSSSVQINWGEIPRPSAFYDRDKELAQLQQWLLVDRCAVVTILGMGGAGKTALVAKAVRLLAARLGKLDPADNNLAACAVRHQILRTPQRCLQFHALSNAPDSAAAGLPFSHIIWRSLLDAPPLVTLLPQWLEILAGHPQSALPATLSDQLTLLFTHLRRQRCLLVLDNLDSLLAAETEAGIFRPGYEEYNLLIQRMGEMEHQSCLLLTSREQSLQAAQLERNYPQVRSMTLAGLPSEPGIKILQAAGLVGPPEQMAKLVAQYSGNPLALKLIAETIQDFYTGDIDAFLAENMLIFGDIRHVLDQQFQRLSVVERAILFWLAIAKEPLSSYQLRGRLLNLPSKRLLIEALRSLQRRSLLETVDSRIRSVDPVAAGNHDSLSFALPNVMAGYLTDLLPDRPSQELGESKLDLFRQYGRDNPQAKEYVRVT